MKLAIELVILFSYITLIYGYIENPGSRYPPTKGEIWPRPRIQDKFDDFFVLRQQQFEIKVTSNNSCTILQDAIVRLELIISSAYGTVQKASKLTNHDNHKNTWLNDVQFLGYMDSLEVVLYGTCGDLDYPTENMDEAYSIDISVKQKKLWSSSVWGLLRGLESFYQSIYIADDYLSLRINATYVEDRPRFHHRGLLLDTSRHFIPLDKIALTVDAMAQNKLNVFHWHIVDDQSFPYMSKKFPELSTKGAYSPYHIYTPAQIATVIEFARLRGIRVIPEFDTPGHTRSWGVAHPEILTACEGDYAGKFGPLNPARNETYDFLNDLFTEVKGVFPDPYIHLGGDEVEFECWQSNSNITAFMKQQNITGNYKALESYYIQKVINLVEKLNYQSIVWEEVFNNGVQIPNTTVVHVWKQQWLDTLDDVTHSGYDAILSSCWYLDDLQSNGDWEKFYSCEPFRFTDNVSQQEHVIGGEACMWAEVVDGNNVISRVWPRASAAAEKLWYIQDDDYDITVVKRRLEEHSCRMNRRGIAAQPPNGPGFCV